MAGAYPATSSATSLLRLRPRPLRIDAVEVIRAAIISGELPEGARVNESRLSTKLGISRGPIREALRALELEGHLVSRPNYGTYVASFTLEDVIESITVRELVEPYAIARSVEQARPALVDGLRATLRDMRQAARNGDGQALATRHDDFHGLFYIHAQHRLILSIWQRLRVPLQSHIQIQQVGYRRPQDIPRAHEQLLTLVEANDRKALETEIISHLHMNLARLTAAMSPLKQISVKPPSRSRRTGRT